MGVVGPSSVADGLPLLHLGPYLSPPLPFSTAVVRLVALQIQVCLPWPTARPLELLVETPTHQCSVFFLQKLGKTCGTYTKN